MINSKSTNDSSVNLKDEKFYHSIVMKKSHHAKIPKVLNIKKLYIFTIFLQRKHRLKR